MKKGNAVLPRCQNERRHEGRHGNSSSWKLGNLLQVWRCPEEVRVSQNESATKGATGIRGALLAEKRPDTIFVTHIPQRANFGGISGCHRVIQEASKLSLRQGCVDACRR